MKKTANFVVNAKDPVSQIQNFDLTSFAEITVTAPTIKWPSEIHHDLVQALDLPLFPQFTPTEKFVMYAVAVGQTPTIKKDNKSDDFANSFARKVSDLSAVVTVFSIIEGGAVDISTIFDSDDAQTYHQIYEIEQQVFAKFRGVKADFHCINIRNLGDCSVEELIPRDAKILLSRS